MIKKGDLKKDTINQNEIKKLKLLLDQFYDLYSKSDYQNSLQILNSILNEIWLMNSIIYLKKPENKIYF